MRLAFSHQVPAGRWQHREHPYKHEVCAVSTWRSEREHAGEFGSATCRQHTEKSVVYCYFESTYTLSLSLALLHYHILYSLPYILRCCNPFTFERCMIGIVRCKYMEETDLYVVHLRQRWKVTAQRQLASPFTQPAHERKLAVCVIRFLIRRHTIGSKDGSVVSTLQRARVRRVQVSRTLTLGNGQVQELAPPPDGNRRGTPGELPARRCPCRLAGEAR